MTASTDIEIRPSALPVLVHPMARTTAMDPFVAANITEALAAMKAARAAWERQISAAMPCTALDDDLWEDEDSWVSPMTGSKQKPVTTVWSALDWSQARGAA